MSDIPNVRMNTSSMSDTEILDLFEAAFIQRISEPNRIDDPEFEIERLVESDSVRIFANLYGMAGSPTVDTYKDTEGVGGVQIARFDKGILNFRLVAGETRAIGGNEYQVVYDSE